MNREQLEKILAGLLDNRKEIDKDIRRTQTKLNDLLVEKFHNESAIEQIEKDLERIKEDV